MEVLTKIDHLDNDVVRQLVESNKSAHQAFVELIEKEKTEKHCNTLFAEQLAGSVIKRNGDIVVGFYAKGAVEYEIALGGQYYITNKLSNQQFAYALFDELPILLISTRFHEVKVTVTKGNRQDMYVIYAILDTNSRRFLAQNKFYAKCPGYDKKYLATSSGMFSLHDSEPEGFLQLPRWNSSPCIEQMKQLASKRTCILRREFAETTWRPDRFMHWCLPFDEVPEDATYKYHQYLVHTKLYLNDVILIEDVATNIQDIDPFLKSQRMTRLGHFNRIDYKQDGGLPLHKDNPLQGGEVSVVFYLNNADGGHIVFPESGVRIMPKKGRCLIFDVNVLHYVEPIASGTKEVLTCECVYV